MYLVGLTGGIATGKSTVVGYMLELNVPVIDTDVIARQVVEVGEPAYLDLRRAFGAEYFDVNTGELLREKLGAHVFANVEARKTLNRITHPRIRTKIISLLTRYVLAGEQFVVLDCPLLFEVGADKFVQKTIVVSCSNKLQIERLLQRNPTLTRQQAMDRINSQMSLEDKQSRGTFLIDNNATIDNIRPQVIDIVNQLRRSYLHWIMRSVVLTVFVTVVFGIRRLCFS